MDKIISLSKNNHIKPVLVVGYLPGYLKKSNLLHDIEKSGGKSGYALFLTKIVQRYPDVIYYEIWNEPDLKKFWKYSYEEYIKLLKISYTIIKKNNKKAKVTNGGLANKNISYVKNMLNDTLGYIDFFSIHFYYHWDKPKYNKIKYINNVCEITSRYNIKIWITETGIPTGGYSKYNYKRRGYYPYSQARELIKLLILIKSIEYNNIIEQVFLYSYIDNSLYDSVIANNFGVFYFDKSPKPSFKALKFLNKILPKIGECEVVKISFGSSDIYCDYSLRGKISFLEGNPLSKKK